MKAKQVAWQVMGDRIWGQVKKQVKPLVIELIWVHIGSPVREHVGELENHVWRQIDELIWGYNL